MMQKKLVGGYVAVIYYLLIKIKITTAAVIFKQENKYSCRRFPKLRILIGATQKIFII